MLLQGNHETRSDTDLVQAYKRDGDLAILGELFNRYKSLVYGVCLKYLKDRDDSRDAVMQLFEKLIQTLKDHEVTHFKSWLYVTARNHCLMQLRSRKGRHFEEISPELMENDDPMHLETVSDREADIGKLEKCIEALGSEQKQCVRLFYIEQQCYKDITETTGFDLKKVKSYIQNGKRNLKICMERHE